jgi:hypothetical protein
MTDTTRAFTPAQRAAPVNFGNVFDTAMGVSEALAKQMATSLKGIDAKLNDISRRLDDIESALSVVKFLNGGK